MRINARKPFGSRTCPGCASPVACNENRCPVCGYEFPQPAPPRRALGWIAAVLALALLALLLGCGVPPAPPPASPAEARRIVSLAPNVTELLFALGAGDRLVGRTSACDRPPDAAAVPVIGGFGRPSLERLLLARPDLVLDVDLEDEHWARAIKRAGIARERLPFRELDDIPAAIRRLGHLAGVRAAAERLAGSLEHGLAEARRRPRREPQPRVYVEIWPDPPMTAGRASFVAELIRLAGGLHLGDAAGRDYYALSSEAVIAFRPDIIIALYPADPVRLRGRLAARPGWRDLPAVARNTVFVPDDADAILRPGPRVLEGLATLERLFETWRRDSTNKPSGG